MSLWQKLKNLLKSPARNALLAANVKELEEKIIQLEKNLCDPRKVLEKIMKRGISFYDYDNVDNLADKIIYYNNIQKVLNNESFMNEYSHFLADMIQEVATSQEVVHRDKQLRYSINGVQTFIERLQDLTNPVEKESTKDDLHAVIWALSLLGQNQEKNKLWRINSLLN